MEINISAKLIFAIVIISLALVFYTLGVFWERKDKILKKHNVVIFYLGLLCDTVGTLTMSSIAKQGNTDISQSSQALHGFTGALAIFLMLFHVVWATWVLYKKDEKKQESFHKFSILVWLIWLIPYGIGVMIGMK